ncbi:uncharacterized protein LOC135368707 [Ornithodoros turicata]|uniref:uncharacterized protein LOC135368707 n=1 Tax=Ornithodoros turicata TaxID=34597 RepID=UPI00313A24D1
MDIDGVQIKQEPPDYEEDLDYVLPERQPSPLPHPMETPAVKVELDEEMHEISAEEIHEVTVEDVVKEEIVDEAGTTKEEPHKVEAVKVKEEPQEPEEVKVKEEPKDEPETPPVVQTADPAVSVPAAAGIPPATSILPKPILPAACRMVLVPSHVVNHGQPRSNVVAAPITLPVPQATVFPTRVILPAEHRNGVLPTQVVQPLVQQNGVAATVREVPWSQLWIQPTGTTSVTPAADEEKGPPRKKTKMEYSEGAADAVYTEPSTNTKGGKTRRDVQTQFPTWEFVEERSSGTQTCGASQGVAECGIQTSGKNESATLVSAGTGTTEPWPPKTEAEEAGTAKSTSKGGQKKKAGAKKR